MENKKIGIWLTATVAFKTRSRELEIFMSFHAFLSEWRTVSWRPGFFQNRILWEAAWKSRCFNFTAFPTGSYGNGNEMLLSYDQILYTTLSSSLSIPADCCRLVSGTQIRNKVYVVDNGWCFHLHHPFWMRWARWKMDIAPQIKDILEASREKPWSMSD